MDHTVIFFCRSIFLNYDNLNVYFHLGINNIISVIPEIFLTYMFLLLFSYIILIKYFVTSNVVSQYNERTLNLTRCFLGLLMLILIFSMSLYYNSCQVLNYDFYLKDTHFILYIKLMFLSGCFFFYSHLYYAHIYKIIFFNFIDLEFCFYLIINFFSLLFLLSSNNFLSFFLCLELNTFSSYMLFAYKKNSIFSIESVIKYFILNTIFSCFLLLGIISLYFLYGSINLTDIQLLSHVFFFNITYTSFNLNVEWFTNIFDYIYNQDVLTITNLWLKFLVFPNFLSNDISWLFILSSYSVLLIFIYLFFKLAIAPFHFWSPDVYTGTFFFNFFYFNLIPKFILLVIFIKFLFNYFNDYINIWSNVFFYVSLCSIFIGAFSALFQSKIKRFWVYSTINNIGILLLVCINAINPQFFFFFTYLFIYLFLMCGICVYMLHLTKYTTIPTLLKYWASTTSLYILNPQLAITFLLFIFSLSGIPPLLGFFHKFFLYYQLTITLDYWLIILILISTVISSVYYFRLIKIMFFSSTITWIFFRPLNLYASLSLSLVVYLNFTFMFNSYYFFLFTENIALKLHLS